MGGWRESLLELKLPEMRHTPYFRAFSSSMRASIDPKIQIKNLQTKILIYVKHLTENINKRNKNTQRIGEDVE